MSLVFLSLPLFPLFPVLSLLLLFLLIDDGAVLVQDAICGPLDVSKQIAVDQLLAIRLQDMVGCPVIMGIGIDRVDGLSRRSGAPVLVPHHPLDDPLLVLLVVLVEQVHADVLGHALLLVLSPCSQPLRLSDDCETHVSVRRAEPTGLVRVCACVKGV